LKIYEIKIQHVYIVSFFFFLILLRFYKPSYNENFIFMSNHSGHRDRLHVAFNFLRYRILLLQLGFLLEKFNFKNFFWKNLALSTFNPSYNIYWVDFTFCMVQFCETGICVVLKRDLLLLITSLIYEYSLVPFLRERNKVIYYGLFFIEICLYTKAILIFKEVPQLFFINNYIIV
jgi:hypothetical protein